MKELSLLSKNLGKRISEIRKSKSLSLSKASELTGVSKAMLGQIERFESSPTVDLLWKLADGFDVRYTELLEPHAELSVVDRGDAPDQKMSVRTIFSASSESKFDQFDIVISPGFEVIRESHENVYEEYVWVLSGAMEVYFDQQWHALRKDESLRFRANQQHGYRTRDSAVRFSNTLVYP